MTQRLFGVAGGIFIAILLAMPAHARTSPARTAGECFTNEDGGARRICTAPRVAAAPAPRSERRKEAKPQPSATATAVATVSAIGNDLVAEARRYLGTNPTGRRSLWCGAFMDLVLKRTGHRGGGNLALGYTSYGRRVPGPQVGAIAVMTRRGGGHVGVVAGVDARGNIIVVSGNHNNTVAEAVYPRSRIIAYVVPSA